VVTELLLLIYNKLSNVNCFDFFFFYVFLIDVMGEKNHKLQRTAQKYKKKTPEKN